MSRRIPEIYRFKNTREADMLHALFRQAQKVSFLNLGVKLKTYCCLKRMIIASKPSQPNK